MAAVATAEPADAGGRKGPSLVIQVGVLLFLTAAAAGAGWFSGSSLGQEAAPQAEEPAPSPAAEKEAGGKEAAPPQHGGEGETEDAPILRPGVVQLQAITTNLAAPSNVWIRLEMALVFDGEPDQVMAETIHQDLMAYVRTLSLPQIEGASGFQHLRADLEERAAIRSQNRVRKILIRTLLFE